MFNPHTVKHEGHVARLYFYRYMILALVKEHACAKFDSPPLTEPCVALGKDEPQVPKKAFLSKGDEQREDKVSASFEYDNKHV